jgi:ferredoxin-NADP reductase
MSLYLDALQTGHSIIAESKPVGKLSYLGYGMFNIAKLESIGVKRKLGFIAGGTGIAPCLSVIKASVNQNDGVNLSLLFFNIS